MQLATRKAKTKKMDVETGAERSRKYMDDPMEEVSGLHYGEETSSSSSSNEGGSYTGLTDPGEEGEEELQPERAPSEPRSGEH